MPKERRKDIFFIQPGYAHYRDQLFSILSKRHDIHFVYEHSFNVYPGEVTPGVISHTFLDRKFGTRWRGLIYYIIKHQPRIVISSVSSSFRSIVSFVYVPGVKSECVRDNRFNRHHCRCGCVSVFPRTFVGKSSM